MEFHTITNKVIIRACDYVLIAAFFIECCILDLSFTPNVMSTHFAESMYIYVMR